MFNDKLILKTPRLVRSNEKFAYDHIDIEVLSFGIEKDAITKPII
jgi:hypothetical protein